MGKWLKNNWAYLLWVGIFALGYRTYQRTLLMDKRGKYTVGYLGGWIQNIKGGALVLLHRQRQRVPQFDDRAQRHGPHQGRALPGRV